MMPANSYCIGDVNINHVAHRESMIFATKLQGERKMGMFAVRR